MVEQTIESKLSWVKEKSIDISYSAKKIVNYDQVIVILFNLNNIELKGNPCKNVKSWNFKILSKLLPI